MTNNPVGEVGSIEYVRSLVDSDSAIAIQCRDALVAKCKTFIAMSDGSGSIKEIEAIALSIDNIHGLLGRLEQRLYGLCSLAFDTYDTDFDMSVVFPDSEELELLMVKFKEIIQGKTSGERDRVIRNAACAVSTVLRFISKWNGQTFQHGLTNAYGDEDDPKFWDHLMRNKEIKWPDRTLHPYYSPKVLVEKLVEMDESLLSAIATEQEKLKASEPFNKKAIKGQLNLSDCSMLVQGRASSTLARMEWMEGDAIAHGN